MFWRCSFVSVLYIVPFLYYNHIYPCHGAVHEKVMVPQLNKKVKCTLVQALRLCTGRTAHRGSRGIALPFHDHGTRRV